MSKLFAAVDELLNFLKPSERRELDEHLAHLKPKPKGQPAPKQWRARVRKLFPRYASKPFAPRHEQLWEWGAAIELHSSPDPFAAFWPRGGAKSTSAEMLVVDLGCRGKRKYCLYVRMTQDQADKSVANIASLLESDEIAVHYPEHADRAVGKFGNSKGWRREQLRTAGGFTVDALGLDTASRGVKVDEQRPDLIIFDDIDDKLDGPNITAKKIAILTTSILPAGSNNVAVLFIQNLIIRDGIASQLADGRADFLIKRKISGPFPAVENLKYEWQVEPETGVRRAVITGGTASWEGQDLEACQAFIDRWGLSAFLKEAQHAVKDRAEGAALRFDEHRHYADLTDEECRQLIALGRAFGGIDFGAWRFAFTLWCVDRIGIVYRIDEFFGERVPGKASLSDRARIIHQLCEFYGIVDAMIPIWGDAANPTDILEINIAFRNGWNVRPCMKCGADIAEGERVCAQPVGDGAETCHGAPGKLRHISSKLRVVAVAMENKSRKTAVEKWNDVLDRNAIKFRRGIVYEWHYGANAGSSGTPMNSSRLMWEIDQWSFPTPKAGEPQDQNPDDSTADGADMIASGRYALLSHYQKAKMPKDFGTYENDRAEPIDYKRGRFKEVPHAVDTLITQQQSARRAPRVHMPRPRTGR